MYSSQKRLLRARMDFQLPNHQQTENDEQLSKGWGHLHRTYREEKELNLMIKLATTG